MTAYAYSDTDDVTEKANIDRAAVERLERDPYGSIAMTDEERKKLVEAERGCVNMAKEIERLAALAQSDAEPVAELKRRLADAYKSNRAAWDGLEEAEKRIEELENRLNAQSDTKSVACVRERVKQAILEKMDKAVLSRDATPETQSRHDARFEATAQKYADAAIAALTQSDAGPVAWPDIDAAEKAGLAWRNPAPDAAPSAYSNTKIVTIDGTAPPHPDVSAGLIEAADMAEKEAPRWPINNGTIALQQFARKLRFSAAAKSTPTWTGNGPMPDDVQGWPDRSASTDEADEDKPLGFRTNDVPDPYAEGPQSNAEPEYYSYPDMDGITTRNVIC